MYASALIGQARFVKKESERIFRCDSPGVERTMAMKIIPDERGELVFKTAVLSLKSVPVVECFTLENPGEIKPGVGTELNWRCSVCNRFKAEDR